MANKTLRRVVGSTGINIRIQCHIHFVFFSDSLPDAIKADIWVQFHCLH